MNKVFLVIAATNYESDKVVKAFGAETAALALAAKCNVYTETRPFFLEPEGCVPNDDVSMAAWDKYERKIKRWCKAHPARKDNAYADEFVVQNVNYE